MCKVLGVTRSYYYKVISLAQAINQDVNSELELDVEVKRLFELNNGVYGSRRISAIINKSNSSIVTSRYVINKSLKRQNLVNVYCKKKKFMPYSKSKTAVQSVANLLDQNFTGYSINEVITSDLTYIPFKDKFFYICFLLDLHNREIVGFSVGEHHNTELVMKAFYTSSINMNLMSIFHSDRGGEFRGIELLNYLDQHGIQRSMSKPGCPFDNAPSERLFRIFKAEWMKTNYSNITSLLIDVTDFVQWYNYFRIHSSLDYKSPVEHRLTAHTDTHTLQV